MRRCLEYHVRDVFVNVGVGEWRETEVDSHIRCLYVQDEEVRRTRHWSVRRRNLEVAFLFNLISDLSSSTSQMSPML